MDKKRIIKTFRRYYGSSAWASLVLNTPRPHISAWLRNKRTVRKLDAAMPYIAELLDQTKGGCMDSARTAVLRIRRGMNNSERMGVNVCESR